MKITKYLKHYGEDKLVEIEFDICILIKHSSYFKDENYVYLKDLLLALLQELFV